MNNNPENFGKVSEQEVSFFVNLTVIGLIIWAVYAVYTWAIEKLTILNNFFYEKLESLYQYIDYFLNLFQ